MQGRIQVYCVTSEEDVSCSPLAPCFVFSKGPLKRVIVGEVLLPVLFQRTAGKNTISDIRRLTTGIRSVKCVVRRLRRCAIVYLHKPR